MAVGMMRKIWLVCPSESVPYPTMAPESLIAVAAFRVRIVPPCAVDQALSAGIDGVQVL